MSRHYIPDPTPPGRALQTPPPAPTPPGRALQTPAPTPDRAPGSRALPPCFPFESAKSAWTFAWTSSARNMSARPGGVTRVTFPAGRVGSKHGAQFRATCGGILPASEATLTYDVFVPADFPGGSRRHGGKLPGFAIGESARDSASGGGASSPRAASVRLMWRETDATRTKIVPYIYFPRGLQQGPLTRGVSHVTHMGTDLWRNAESLFLSKGAWNTVSIRVRVSGAESSISLTVNGAERRVDDAHFARGTRLQTVFFSTFFGGGDEYAPPRHTYLEFRNWNILVNS